MSGSRAYRWLAVVPPLAILVGAPIANGVRLYLLGLPFLLLWIVACVLLTSATMGVILVLDRRAPAPTARDDAPGEPPDSGAKAEGLDPRAR